MVKPIVPAENLCDVPYVPEWFSVFFAACLGVLILCLVGVVYVVVLSELDRRAERRIARRRALWKLELNARYGKGDVGE